MLASWFLVFSTLVGSLNANDSETVEVRVPLNAGRELNVADLVGALSQATGAKVARPNGTLSVPVVGLGGSVSRNAIADLLGPTTKIRIEDKSVVVRTDLPSSGRDWEQRLQKLAAHVEEEARRQAHYGMHALKSYRANDPARPTVCLVHGLNSSSGGFKHMIEPLESAGFGVVVFDYPYNRALAESCSRFQRDWAAFRLSVGEKRPWAIVAHSMGALIARAYVENDEVYAGDVSHLLLIAPVNQGSSLARAQTMLQLLNSVQAVQGNKPAEALSHLGDGLGEAAEDLLPGSHFLKALNRRSRRAGVSYHILAGDVGFVSQEMRQKVQARLDALQKGGGFLGGLVRFAAGDLEDQLDEVCDGTGDGCVTVKRTRLEGVTDHVTIHANHAELIRAPLLFRDPGPVACMPYLLRWLAIKPADRS